MTTQAKSLFNNVVLARIADKFYSGEFITSQEKNALLKERMILRGLISNPRPKNPNPVSDALIAKFEKQLETIEEILNGNTTR